MEHAWILAGATATGKTAVAQLLAEQLGCAILSADAMLVYRNMDIGTAKPLPAERGHVPYYGIDLVTPAESFSTGLWLADAARALCPPTSDLCPPTSALRPPLSGSHPLLVAGGTGLYIKALTEGFESEAADPAVRARWQTLFETEGLAALQQAISQRAPGALATLSDTSNPRRLLRALEHLDAHGTLPQQWKNDASSTAPIVVLHLPRPHLHARIERRVATMFRQGLIEEVRALRQTFPVWSPTARQAIGYAEVCALLDGTLTVPEATERIIIRTRQLAKRQETWFRHQAHAVWLDIDADDPPAQIAQRVLETWRQYGPTTVVSP